VPVFALPKPGFGNLVFTTLGNFHWLVDIKFTKTRQNRQKFALLPYSPFQK